MPDALRHILVAIVGAVSIWGLATLLGRSTSSAFNGRAGTIRPGLWSSWLTVFGGSVVLAVESWAWIYREGGWGAATAAVLGAAAAGFMVPSVTSVHAVHWNEEGIEGPSKLFGPTLGAARTKIAWREIAKTGKTITGYWYVESDDRRRVYWSFLYKGYGALMLALRSNRPSLELRF